MSAAQEVLAVQAPRQAAPVAPQAPEAQQVPSPQAPEPQSAPALSAPPPERKQNRPPHIDKWQATLADKHAKAIAALRAERGVPEPVAPAVAPPTPALQTPPPPTAPDYAQMFGAYDAKQRAAQDAEAKAQVAIQEAQRARQEADARMKKLETSVADPVAFLAELGMTQDEWQAFLLNGGKMTPEQKALKEFQKSQIETDRRINEMQARLDAAQNAAKRAQAVNLVGATLDLNQYPLFRKVGGNADFVLSQIENHHKATGQILTPQAVAQHYEQQYQSQLQNWLQDDTIRTKVIPANSAPLPTANLAAAPSTLNSRVTSSTGPATSQPGPLDWEAKKQLALARIQAGYNANNR